LPLTDANERDGGRIASATPGLLVDSAPQRPVAFGDATVPFGGVNPERSRGVQD
jgi:hypothetical protein